MFGGEIHRDNINSIPIFKEEEEHCSFITGRTTSSLFATHVGGQIKLYLNVCFVTDVASNGTYIVPISITGDFEYWFYGWGSGKKFPAGNDDYLSKLNLYYYDENNNKRPVFENREFKTLEFNPSGMNNYYDVKVCDFGVTFDENGYLDTSKFTQYFIPHLPNNGKPHLEASFFWNYDKINNFDLAVGYVLGKEWTIKEEKILGLNHYTLVYDEVKTSINDNYGGLPQIDVSVHINLVENSIVQTGKSISFRVERDQEYFTAPDQFMINVGKVGNPFAPPIYIGLEQPLGDSSQYIIKIDHNLTNLDSNSFYILQVYGLNNIVENNGRSKTPVQVQTYTSGPALTPKNYILSFLNKEQDGENIECTAKVQMTYDDKNPVYNEDGYGFIFPELSMVKTIRFWVTTEENQDEEYNSPFAFVKNQQDRPIGGWTSSIWSAELNWIKPAGNYVIHYSIITDGTGIETEITETFAVKIYIGAIVRVKDENIWKEGKVYVKVDGTWKEATTIYVKENGEWKESISS